MVLHELIAILTDSSMFALKILPMVWNKEIAVAYILN